MVLSRLIRLTSRDVFTNLAAEERLFNRTTANSLLFYINTTSIVLGRTQNPFNECDVLYANSHSIPISRRRSGGGTVVHDDGNLNFCFMRPRDEHHPLQNAALVAKVLRNEFGIRASVNHRADILVDGHKVSGAAYRISRNRAYHHGTLLINADLPRLKRLLKSPLRDALHASGTKSVPATVTNLQAHYSGVLKPVDVMQAIGEYYLQTLERNVTRVQPVSSSQVELDCGGMQAERGELCSHEWVYGKTPPFTFDLDAYNGLVLRFHLAKGAVVDRIAVESETNPPVAPAVMHAVNDALRQLPFDGVLMAEALSGLRHHAFVQLLAGVLRQSIPTRFVANDVQAVED